jgi:hypothetical protein
MIDLMADFVLRIDWSHSNRNVEAFNNGLRLLKDTMYLNDFVIMARLGNNCVFTNL